MKICSPPSKSLILFLHVTWILLSSLPLSLQPPLSHLLLPLSPPPSPSSLLPLNLIPFVHAIWIPTLLFIIIIVAAPSTTNHLHPLVSLLCPSPPLCQPCFMLLGSQPQLYYCCHHYCSQPPPLAPLLPPLNPPPSPPLWHPWTPIPFSQNPRIPSPLMATLSNVAGPPFKEG